MDTFKMKKEELTLADAMKYPKAGMVILKGFDAVTKCRSVIHYLESDWYKNNILLISNCQLILRSIDQITEKEKEEFFKIANNKSDGSHFMISNFQFFKSDILLTNYLRLIGIDIDGFIENGKAVKNEN